MDTAEGTAAFLQASSLAWVAMTVLAYRVALTVYQWTGRSAFANPVFVSVIIVMAVLSITRTPYAVYADGAQSVHLLIGPATVAMAVPLYTHTERLKTVAGSLLVALLVGSITAILSAVVIGWLFGASADTLLSLAPKSTTMPVAMGITEKVGGLPSLTSLTVTITGISGAIMARGVLDRAAVDDMAARGFAIGVTSHAIGTAYALQISEVAGAFAALGMGLNSIATTVLLPVMVHLLARL